MNQPPGAQPATQEASASSMRGSSKDNPNFVAVVNPAAWGGRDHIHRNKANHYAETGRGEYVAGGFSLFEDHPQNVAAKLRARQQTARGYDAITDQFRLYVGQSGGASVQMFERGTARQ